MLKVMKETSVLFELYVRAMQLLDVPEETQINMYEANLAYNNALDEYHNYCKAKNAGLLDEDDDGHKNYLMAELDMCTDMLQRARVNAKHHVKNYHLANLIDHQSRFLNSLVVATKIDVVSYL